MLTVDFDRLRLPAAARVLDLGCGAGRHAFELYRRGAHVVAVDWSASEVTGVRDMFHAMREAGEVPAEATAGVACTDALHLPFPDAVFDAVVAAEVLEHIADDTRAIAELARVVRPGGTVVVTVPRWWPERVCWALSTAYHQVEGGHVRIYRRRDLLSRLDAAALRPQGSHHAHALHSPYWWLRCAYGPDNNQARLPRLYHQMLVYDIMHRPWWTRTVERLLNPLLGKSLVVYLTRAR